MSRVKSGDIMQLHHALTESECIICGRSLQWQLDFKDISRLKYVSHHCGYRYAIYVDSVKIEATRAPDTKEKQKTSDEPRAILIAQTKKKERRVNGRKY